MRAPRPADPAASGAERPFVSVVMPVRNEADFVAESLGAVLAQDYPHDRIEVLVADGMSSDGTRDIVQRVAAAAPDIPVSLVDNPGRIVPTGLNLALERARGDIIVRIDGHCRIAPDYVSRCVEHLLVSKVDGVGGPIRTIARTRVGQAIAAAMSSKFGVGSSMFRTVSDRTLLVDTIAFPAYTRAALRLAGPFDEALVRNQDDEYNYRLRKLGGRLLLAADVRSDYYSRSTLASLCRQYFQYGFYKVQVMRKHPRQMSPRQFVPPAFVSGLIMSPVAGAVSPMAWHAALIVFGLYAVATLAVSSSIARRQGWAHAPALVAAFPALHISYGLGFLAGCARLIAYKRSEGEQAPRRGAAARIDA